ncbi:TonB-dependent receptor plug domain-containing protein [Novosphingobium mangrovi (ex Huang et al. 2023)]|uniref:TonB-dependent receptor n=1 Tax=Novosphingobium mangrovi (ex Huang et al. 2023) TaxID=2976432 RepID=A0ABT2I0X8_9SPHN|nr:TonB-dependent receptor [Novosphingobium mangrovi (ex Huang et al. 2023)]MCT2398465.1 TonB-dependent receptor [Novosphingobium mangrovi (ex Huang et al. 2023)]
MRLSSGLSISNRHLWSTASPLVLGLASVLTATPAFAEAAAASAASVDAGTSDEGASIVVTGSRRAARSPSDVPAPVDIVSAAELSQQPSPDVSNQLRLVVPSLNVNDNPISGTSAGIRPVTLRGLSPDHTLVLVNGKRFNRSADIPSFSGGLSDGSQSPDISVIPSIALKQVQVLRDGAAAQYGADAIAGVVNFIMNDDVSGGLIQSQFSSTYEGDGDTYQVAGTYGVPVGDTGFVRLSGEYSSADRAVRAVQRDDAAALQAAGYTGVPDPATRFGTPQIRDNIKLFLNSGVDVGIGELYAFGGYSSRKTSVDFFYRNPIDRDGVFTDGAGNFLVGDMTPDDGVACPGTGADAIPVGSADAAARLAEVIATPNCFATASLYPGGYSPYFINKVKTVFGTAGLRGELLPDLQYDLSFGASRYKMSIYVHNSINPSLGSDSPTEFYNGSRIQEEQVANLDLSYPLEVGFATPLNIAGGVEWHREKFTVKAGEPASYEAGVLATQGFTVGEDAYAGYSPDIAGSRSRDNWSFYLDLETNPIEQLDLGLAARYESFSDFGDKVTYKVSGLFHITDSLGVRSTYATGFHAPSPGQQAYTGLGQQLTADGTLVQTGIIPADNPIALAVGGQKLKPETSKSFSAGLVFDEPWLNVTIDYFNIKMKNRLTQSQSYSLTDLQRADLIAQGYAFASQIGTFKFFTNDFSSTTQGVDVVATVPLNFIPAGQTAFSAAMNYTKNEVTSYDPSDPNELLDEGRVIQLEKMLPRWRGNATITHSSERWHGLVRMNYFGKYTELHVNSLGLRFDPGSEITFDAEVGFKPLENLDIAVGATDIFDNRPDLNPYRGILGSKYPTTSPMGLAGGTYYIRAGITF